MSDIDHLRRLTEDSYSKLGEARIGDVIFRASTAGGWIWEMDPSEESAIMASIRQARASARFVLFSIHAHETAGHDDARTPPGDFEAMAIHRANEAPSPLESRPADFEPILCHAAIDAGADAVARTGPHVLDGIEIYRSKPIFHGLGGLFFDRDGRRGHEIPGGFVPFPEEQFESVVPVATYRQGQASVIRLYPVVIADDNQVVRGNPHLAMGSRALDILKRPQALSSSSAPRLKLSMASGSSKSPRRLPLGQTCSVKVSVGHSSGLP